MLVSMIRRSAMAIGLLIALSGFTQAAFAQFPQKPIHLVVPFAPGGGTDLIARVLGAEMAKDLGQTVIVENKPGAGTMIGTDYVAKSAPDGYTVVVASFAHAINPSLQPKLSYGSNEAFAPVVLIGRGPNVLVVREGSPYESVQDIVAAAKSDPGGLTFASQGTGTSAHLAGEMFANLAKVQLTHVPYRGAGPALTDLLGGHVDMMFATAAAVSNFGGKLRLLGVTTEEPAPTFEGVAPIADTVPDYRVESWYGLYVPAGTPAEVIDRLNAAARAAARSPEFVGKLEHEGLVIVAGTPEELDVYVRAEEERWAKIVEENGIRPD